MEIQDCDELLYTSQEAKLMKKYSNEVRSWDKGISNKEACEKLAKDFETLSNLISEYEDRINLTAGNVTDPTQREIQELKKLFDTIESLDFATSEVYEELNEK